jgi:uncharacterized protein (TIGR03118 family)
MKTIRVPLAIRSFGVVVAISALQFSLAVLPCARAQGNFFTSVNLQSDIAGVAERTDPNLVNSWGLVINPNAQVFWVADNGRGVSTLYRPDGTPVPLGQSGQNFVTLPPTQVDKKNPSAPTGIVFNSSSDAFLIPNTASPAPAIFLFDGEDGGIWGWNPGVNLLNAVLVVQPKSPNKNTNSVYKGLAIANSQIGGAIPTPTLYATNFRAGTIDVFDTGFRLVAQFKDPNPPPVPAGAVGWGPFGIANINGDLYVTFAAQNAARHDDVAGPGNGFVDVFTPEGVLTRLITGGNLNSPWGLAKVPQQFGTFDSNVLLVGNFGDGHINAYNVNSGAPIGTLSRSVGPLEFNGLWALFFFDNQLYFTAGIVDEAHGLFGFIVPE